ncbi:heavy-metal-associated domain-containing protein [Microbispora sp. CA-102843]|uniref:heavy-metal-associated domain-containing protein n=1 Tax=Microbispora sp. CA-102843 TaxID=3239952 RepID=UPI003D90F364
MATAEAGTADGKVYSVSGMTCGHCVSSVSGEIGKIGGVTGVAVDLPTGAVTVSGSGFTDEEIRAAVEQAGYALAGRS